MKLSELLKNIHPLRIEGPAEIEIADVNIDSRRIATGHLFVAMRGTQVDGHQFIPKAVSQRAAARRHHLLRRSFTPPHPCRSYRYQR